MAIVRRIKRETAQDVRSRWKKYWEGQGRRAPGGSLTDCLLIFVVVELIASSSSSGSCFQKPSVHACCGEGTALREWMTVNDSRMEKRNGFMQCKNTEKTTKFFAVSIK